MSVDNDPDLGAGPLSDAQQQLSNFWHKVTEEVRSLNHNDLKQQELPLARIKRIMKLDDEVKMISAEAPALFSKAAEIFITELTLRAWVHTEDNKRRTLQRNDIAMAITKCDQFDFLIDIVPRDELKPPKTREETGRIGLPTDQHYFQIAQHYQTVLQQASGSANPQNAANQGSLTPQTIQIVQAGGQVQSLQQSTQIIQLQPQTQTQQQQAQQQTQQQANAGGIQIIQQIMGSDGQIQQFPIQLTQQQLQMIKLQMSGVTQQPIIIQTAPIQSVNQTVPTTGSSQPQIIQLQQMQT